jgi:DNA-binding transcriptional LysR family regulator
MLTSTRLRQVVVLAEHGSFRRAAAVLKISQPALTKGIQALEAALGVPLFDRQPTSVTLTEFGKRVVRHTQAVEAAEGDLLRDIALLRGLEAGSINVALGPYPSVLSGHVAAARLIASYPKFGIAVRVAGWRAVTRAVAERKVDLGIAELSDAVLNEALATELVGQHRARIFCRPGHPLLTRGRVSLSDLFEFPWANTRVPPRVAGAFPRPPGRAGHIDELTGDFVPAVELDVPMQLAEFAKGSDVLVFATFAMVERELEAGTLAVVRAPALDMRASYGFIYLKHRSLSPGTRAYMQFVRDQESVIVEREARLERLYA